MICFMFGLNAILYSDQDIRNRFNLNKIPDSNKILYDMPKSLYSFVITIGINFGLGLIFTIPNETEEYLMKTLRTKNKILIPKIQ